MKLKWRIVKSRTGWHAQGGLEIKPGEGVNPGFVIYHSARFDTRRQAERYIKQH